MNEDRRKINYFSVSFVWLSSIIKRRFRTQKNENNCRFIEHRLGILFRNGLWTHKCLKNFCSLFFFAEPSQKKCVFIHPHPSMCIFLFILVWLLKGFLFTFLCLYFPIHPTQRQVIWLKRFTHSFRKCEHKHKNRKNKGKRFFIIVSIQHMNFPPVLSLRTKPTWNI